MKDPQYRHRITYWDLLEGMDSPDKLISVALEKISVCDTNKGVNNSYVIRFESKYNFDEITINSVWATENGFKKGGGSPIRIDNLADLRAFEKALRDFKFMHSLEGHNIKKAIIDFAVKLVANLNYEGR
ncbi:MAG: hypothetical protein GKR95_16285 [Gammaproteobacteria bacterium]|nr:hypothetical protein [Gammaproteobacteria bacterium]NKB63599.1 hypothetical protein [Gammaproteobacteria bacterium]